MRMLKLIQRLGSKDNDIKFFKDLLPECDIIVEPFSGSFAVCRYYYESKKDKNYKYHINDTDPLIYEIYKEVKKFKTFLLSVFNDYELIDKKIRSRLIREKNDGSLFYNYFINNYIIRGNIVKIPKMKTFNESFENILLNESNIITNDDYKIILEKYINDENAFIFLDPPYLFSDNSHYSNQSNNLDSTDIYIELLTFFKKCKCKAMLIINDLAILRYLFKEFNIITYDKTYNLSKKKDKHMIITNY